MKVVITDTAEPMNRDLTYEKDLLRSHLGDSIQIVSYIYEGNRDELKEVIKDADGIVTSYLPFDSELLEYCDNLKIISIEATGYNNVDIEAAKRLGISVAVIGEYCTEEVSDYIILAAMTMNKQLKYYINQSDQEHQFDFKVPKKVNRLSQSTFGIMGLGKIGSEVARKAQTFGMRVIAFSTPHAKERAKKLGVTLVSLDELLAQSDFIALTMRLTDGNRNILNENTFKKMIKQPIIINIARGAMISESALLDALQKGTVRGAALDVLIDESPEGLNKSPLVGRDDVLITPHAAFNSDQSLLDCERLAIENLYYCLLDQKHKMFRLVTK